MKTLRQEIRDIKMNDIKEKKLFIQDWIRKFEAHVMDSMDEMHHQNFDDHHEFMKAAMDAYCMAMESDENPWD